MVANLSSLDIHFLIPEFQYLVDSKIEKIFQTKEDSILTFALHKSGGTKKFLFVALPDVMCISDFKPEFPDVPPSFCSSLRRKITSARIASISQVGFERIIQIDLTTKHGDAKLFFEMFSTGNVILVDKDNKILSVAKSQTWGKRVLKTNEEYKLPPSQEDITKISSKDLLKNLNSSEKESVVKSLAIDFGLGGIFAEEILFNANIDKNIVPNDIDENIANKIHKEITNLLKAPLKPHILNGQFYPIELNHLISNEKKYFETFNEAINNLVFENYKKTEEKKVASIKKESISKLDRVIKAQSSQVKGLDKSQQENQDKGEQIYKHYTEIKLILDFIKESKKSKSWEEIKKELKKNPLFLSLDEHNGTITLNLE